MSGILSELNSANFMYLSDRWSQEREQERASGFSLAGSISMCLQQLQLGQVEAGGQEPGSPSGSLMQVEGSQALESLLFSQVQ